MKKTLTDFKHCEPIEYLFACYSSTMNSSKIIICLIAIIVNFSIISTNSLYAENKTNKIIRFYKLNKKEQQNRLLIRESHLRKTGCHNFTTTPTIYRLTQIGFEYCAIYVKKDCPAGTEVMGSWGNKKRDTKLTQGGTWFFNQTFPHGEKVKSWYCH